MNTTGHFPSREETRLTEEIDAEWDMKYRLAKLWDKINSKRKVPKLARGGASVIMIMQRLPC